jgi:tRNA G18 (ribose-2'-O)-methylase SpoU
MLNIFQDQEEAIINKLKEDGYFVVGTSLQRAVSLTDFALPEGKLCLLLGNEGKGVSQTLLNETNINVKIPIANIDSLNVGVAGGILMQRFSLIK